MGISKEELNKVMDNSCFVNLGAFDRYCKENNISVEDEDKAFDEFEKENGMTLREWLKHCKSRDKIKI